MLDIVQLGWVCMRWMVRRGEPKIFNSSVSIAISHLYRPAADDRGESNISALWATREKGAIASGNRFRSIDLNAIWWHVNSETPSPSPPVCCHPVSPPLHHHHHQHHLAPPLPSPPDSGASTLWSTPDWETGTQCGYSCALKNSLSDPHYPASLTFLYRDRPLVW